MNITTRNITETFIHHSSRHPFVAIVKRDSITPDSIDLSVKYQGDDETLIRHGATDADELRALIETLQAVLNVLEPAPEVLADETIDDHAEEFPTARGPKAARGGLIPAAAPRSPWNTDNRL